MVGKPRMAVPGPSAEAIGGAVFGGITGGMLLGPLGALGGMLAGAALAAGTMRRSAGSFR